MARQFAARGYDLALCARRIDRLEELRGGDPRRRTPGRRVEVRALDVNDDDQVFEVVPRLPRDADARGRTIDRIVVNAGLGKGAPLGTGGYAANRETAMTNFVGALAQAEAAMEIFRAQGPGHLVMISSMSAMRGLPKTMTTYAATEGRRRPPRRGPPQRAARQADQGHRALPRLHRLGDERARARRRRPLMVSTEKGVRAMVDAIEKEKGSPACRRGPGHRCRS